MAAVSASGKATVKPAARSVVGGFADGGSGAGFDVVVPAEFAVGLGGVVADDNLLRASLVPFSEGE
jgi:hypothetical protein